MPNLIRFLLVSAAISAAQAQTPFPTFQSLQPIAFDNSGPALRQNTEALKPFTVAGEHGVLLGQQNGAFESWILPVKILSHLTLQADIEGYGVPIDVNQESAAIEVRPDRTILTYAHPGFTVRQIMFSPNDAPSGTGPLVLYQFDCLHPTDFTFRFTPELRWMWPERNEGTPSPDWVSPNPQDPHTAGGFYILHTDYPDLAAAITIPGAAPGILAPYQERPQVHPVELKLHIDPVRDRNKLFPLLMAAGITPSTATNAALAASLSRLNAAIPNLYAAHAASWKELLSTATTIDTPDKTLNEAFQWAVISIEQLKTKTIPGQSSPPSGEETKANASQERASAAPQVPETALVAGYYTSADSARPGFGWFFGRDALYTLYAVNGYGNFALTKSELEFLIHRQRADGKIMHEYSQTAAAIDWQAFPYMYAAADSTPLFLMAVADYVRSSGDSAFLTEHRDAIEKAWAFETDPAHDTDHDGIYDNSQGTGWVESWPGGMPHQEIYLALLDQQASAAMANIERLLNDSTQAETAQHRAAAIAQTINAEYAQPAKGCYAFSHNADGSSDRTTTVYPAMDWWSGKPILKNPDSCLQQFVASPLNTDWGLRDVADNEKIYDGMSYHQGSVWPLFTGWAALAEYRGNRPLAGYQLLMENANLTRAQDLGSVTELLSGDFFVPFGRSTSHQLWSSAMVITPALRGLFGIAIDAQSKTITVNPHLPASWDTAQVMNLHLSSETASLYFTRKEDHLEIFMSPTEGDAWHLRSDTPGATLGPLDQALFKKLRIPLHTGLRVPLPPIEVDESAGPYADRVIDSVSLLNKPPLPGARTSRIRILQADYSDRKLVLKIQGLAGSDGIVTLIRHYHIDPKVASDSIASNGTSQESATISHRDCDADPYACKSLPLTIHFPSGTGSGSDWQTQTVTLTW
ncbi:MAG: hypothetical protein WCC26_17760 [Terracidiphilus sp.]